MANTEDTVEHFLEHSLERMLRAEKDILKGLDDLREVSHSSELKRGFEKHKKETEAQVDRLEQALEIIKDSKERRSDDTTYEKWKNMMGDFSKQFHFKSDAISGIMKEGKAVYKEFKDTSLNDFVVASGAQAIELGEIASYMNLIYLSQICGYSQITTLLETSLREEQKAYEILSSFCNTQVGKLHKAA